MVKMPIGVKIVMIAAGSHHSIALTSEGDVFSWGAYLVSLPHLYYYFLATKLVSLGCVDSTNWKIIYVFENKCVSKNSKHISLTLYVI